MHQSQCSWCIIRLGTMFCSPHQILYRLNVPTNIPTRLMIPFFLTLILTFHSFGTFAAPLDPITSTVASAGLSAAMMGGVTLYQANKMARDQRLTQLFMAKQSVQDSQSQYSDSRGKADAMNTLAVKSSKSPLLNYQTDLVTKRNSQQQVPAIPPTAQAQDAKSTITFYFGQGCTQGPSITAYMTSFSDTLGPQLQGKVTSIKLTNVNAGSEFEIYADKQPTTSKAYSKFIAKDVIPVLNICNLETSSQSSKHLYVVKPNTQKGELRGFNYFYANPI